MRSFLASHNFSPEKAAGPAFSGLLLTPGADWVLTLPAANDNSVLSHSAEYNALILSVYFQEKRPPQETQKLHFPFPPWNVEYEIYCTVHMEMFIAFKITIQLSSITRKIQSHCQQGD